MTNDKPVALVTGGGTGVGRETVLQLAGRGYRTVVNYSRSAKDAEQTATEAREQGAESMALQADVGREVDVRRMIDDVIDRFQRLDVVVNNAGRTHFVDAANLDGLTEAMWDEMLAVNVKGTFFVTRAAVPHLRKSEGASVVNVSSVAGITGIGSSIGYAATKGALITLTRSFANSLAPAIRVNAVCPGIIKTRWLDDHQEMIEAAIPQTPLKRVCEPTDVADTICFLACDAGMMTGQAIVVDGGRVT